MRVFFDSSALLKRYVHETGSEAVLRLGASGDQIVLSALSFPEVVSALKRMQLEHRLGEDAFFLLKKDFSSDLEEALVENIDLGVLRDSEACIEKTGLKASDAIHLATALRSRVDLFVTADLRQAKAASSLGLKVERVG